MATIKVFTANLGFYETAVAARSQKVALAHWGVTRDLFREGTAKETSEPKAVEAANGETALMFAASAYRVEWSLRRARRCRTDTVEDIQSEACEEGTPSEAAGDTKTAAYATRACRRQKEKTRLTCRLSEAPKP